MTDEHFKRLEKRLQLLKAIAQYYVNAYHYDDMSAFKSAFASVMSLSDAELTEWIPAFCTSTD